MFCLGIHFNISERRYIKRKMNFLISDKKDNKRGQVVSGIIVGVVGLVFLLIFAYVFIDTLTGANLITNTDHTGAVNNLTSNFTSGVENISNKIPTLFAVAAVVLIIGALMFLWGFYQKMRLGNGGGL